MLLLQNQARVTHNNHPFKKVTISINKRNFSTTRRLNMDINPEYGIDLMSQTDIVRAQYNEAWVYLYHRLSDSISNYTEAKDIAVNLKQIFRQNTHILIDDLNEMITTLLQKADVGQKAHNNSISLCQELDAFSSQCESARLPTPAVIEELKILSAQAKINYNWKYVEI